MDIMEFAINMEIEASKFYDEQAEKNKDNVLNTVLLMLARDEKHHADILINKSNELPYGLYHSSTLSDSESVFKDIKDFSSVVKENPDQLDVYRMALYKEQQSIELYQRLLLKTVDDDSKKMFEYLVNQEQDHYKLIEELVQLLKHAEDWVESAEFGLRTEEY